MAASAGLGIEQVKSYLLESTRISADVDHKEVLRSALEGSAAVATHSESTSGAPFCWGQ